MESGDPLPSVRAPTQKELEIPERVAAHNADDMKKVARMDEHEAGTSQIEGVSSQ